MKRILSVLGLLTITMVLAGVASVVAADIDIAPSQTEPAGQTYGRWAAEWWQWALGVPAAENPLTDTTGQFCDQRQVGDVWFLAGASGSAPIDRSCEVPAGKSLFFPLINNVYGAFLNDPPATRTEEYVRDAARCTQPARISLRIDLSNIPKALLTFTGASGSQSPIFNVQLPPGNVFGLDETVAHELVLSPSAEQGYYVFLYPLRPGHHTIKWTASGCTPGSSQDITYHLNVVGGPHH
ncbi:MAG TPA: hypothetical protein VMV94_09090 [Phycisphaerae bacterium]|nr:hypothetical protein [Phycisphaerae bacterium]